MKKFLASLLVLILSFGTISLQAYEEENATEFYIYSHFEFEGMNMWRGVMEDGESFLATDWTYVKSGVTDCGLEFKAFKEPPSSNILSRQISDSTFIERTVFFEGRTTPPVSLAWSEFFSGRTWGGTLQRSFHIYLIDENVTMAIYRGTVWATR